MLISLFLDESYGFTTMLLRTPLYGWALLVCVLTGYLLGSINTGIIVTKIVQHRDIREQGSGNAGMTNVIRTVGKKAGALTFAGDFFKALIACGLALLVSRLTLGVSAPDTMDARLLTYPAGAACVIGHMYPVFFKFRGGKGVATASAVMLMTDWRVFLLILGTFLLIFLWKKIISLGSVVCAALYPVYALILYGPVDGWPWAWPLFVGCALLVGLLCLWKHRSNIRRLARGEEKPITAKRK